jgi:hypothetical protein
MTKKKETSRDPTPTIGLPRANGQIFTYSENKLLDQITCEIMEAWKKDLIIIRNHHQEILASEKSAMELSLLICKEFPKLEKFLERNDFIAQFYNMKEKMDHVLNLQGIMNKSLFDIEKQIEREQFKKWDKRIDEILSKIEQLNVMKKKKWWHFLSK